MTATTAVTMTRDEAAEFRAGHDAMARDLWRKPKHKLLAILREEFGAEGTYSKDEALAAILRRRGYGIVRLNEAVHVLHHHPGEVGSTACAWCVCQETWTEPSGMVPGYDRLVQCGLPPGHGGECVPGGAS